MLRYLHHNKLVELPFVRADLTVLDHLRHDRQQCGTKEGCASGDCGACTVVIAEASIDAQGNDELIYRAVNSCITFAGALQGKQLITVENLAQDSTLHPSQQAMVDCHASQCGFCTPGFVMSLFAAVKQPKCNAICGSRAAGDTENGDTALAGCEDIKEAGSVQITRAMIDEKLGGNLCRCTGYRPIIDAATEALQCSADSDHFDHQQQATIALLRSIAASDAAEESVFLHPMSVAELCQQRAQHPQAGVLAGGTDLALSVTQQLHPIEKIISLAAIKEMQCFKVTDTQVQIGAALSLTEFRNKIVALCPELEPLLIRFGGTQVRNQATVGGNFANASPVGDLPPVFIALNTSIILQSVNGQRVVSASDFFVSYKKTLLQKDEIIREFHIPLDSFSLGSLENLNNSTRVVNRFYKISKRLDDDISAVCAAFHLQLDGDIIAKVATGFGGMAAIPKSASGLEAAIVGRVLDQQCLQDARVALKQDFQPLDDVRGSAGYRNLVCENLLVRLATELYSPQVSTSVISHDG